MHARMLAVCLTLLLLSCLSPLAEAASVPEQDLAMAATAQDMAQLGPLLASAGVDQQALDPLMRDQPGQVTLIDLDGEHELLALTGNSGLSLWCFFKVQGGQAELAACQDMGRYAEMYADPAPLEPGSLILAVKQKAASGSGMYLLGVTWFVLDDSGLTQVLDYPETGDIMGWGQPFDRSFAGNTLFSGWRDGRFVVETQFAPTYMNGYPDDPGYGLVVLTYTAPVLFVYDPESKAFAIDPAASELTREQIDGLFNDGPDEMLAHNFERLKGLIPTADQMTLDWMAKFLAECSDSPAKAELQSMLP